MNDDEISTHLIPGELYKLQNLYGGTNETTHERISMLDIIKMKETPCLFLKHEPDTNMHLHRFYFLHKNIKYIFCFQMNDLMNKIYKIFL